MKCLFLVFNQRLALTRHSSALWHSRSSNSGGATQVRVSRWPRISIHNVIIIFFCFSFLFLYDLGINVRLLSATLDTVTSPLPSLTSVLNEVLWRRLILLRLRGGFRGNYPSTGCSSQIWTVELFIKNHTVSGGGWHVLRCGAEEASNCWAGRKRPPIVQGGLCTAYARNTHLPIH